MHKHRGGPRGEPRGEPQRAKIPTWAFAANLNRPCIRDISRSRPSRQVVDNPPKSYVHTVEAAGSRPASPTRSEALFGESHPGGEPRGEPRLPKMPTRTRQSPGPYRGPGLCVPAYGSMSSGMPSRCAIASHVSHTVIPWPLRCDPTHRARTTGTGSRSPQRDRLAPGVATTCAGRRPSSSGLGCLDTPGLLPHTGDVDDRRHAVAVVAHQHPQIVVPHDVGDLLHREPGVE